MKKLLASVALASMATITNAQTVLLNKAIACTDRDTIQNYISERDLKLLLLGNSYDEVAAPRSDDYNKIELVSAFWVNQDTGEWSLITISSDGIVCLISFGDSFLPYAGSEDDQIGNVPNASR